MSKDEERLEFLKSYENKLIAEGTKLIVGIDEAGRGPLAGPVSVAAVIMKPESNLKWVNDSKKVTEKRRETLYDQIIEDAIVWDVEIVTQSEIDEYNILEATKLAMKRAIDEADKMLESKGRDRIQIVIFDAVKINDLKKEQMSVIKGDQTYFSVAAASILAKVTRDNLMKEYDKVYPEYGFASNKGYGTKAHYEGIKKAGITEIHRKSFLKNLDTH